MFEKSVIRKVQHNRLPPVRAGQQQWEWQHHHSACQYSMSTVRCACLPPQGEDSSYCPHSLNAKQRNVDATVKVVPSTILHNRPTIRDIYIRPLWEALGGLIAGHPRDLFTPSITAPRTEERVSDARTDDRVWQCRTFRDICSREERLSKSSSIFL